MSTAAVKQNYVAQALARQIHHLNIAAMREIEEFAKRGDYNGAHYREDRWREEVLEACEGAIAGPRTCAEDPRPRTERPKADPESILPERMSGDVDTPVVISEQAPFGINLALRQQREWPELVQQLTGFMTDYLRPDSPESLPYHIVRRTDRSRSIESADAELIPLEAVGPEAMQ